VRLVNILLVTLSSLFIFAISWSMLMMPGTGSCLGTIDQCAPFLVIEKAPVESSLQNIFLLAFISIALSVGIFSYASHRS
jgi:hypothetical protein